LHDALPICEGNRIVTSFDMGRTFNTPILKLGVNCIAAISNEKVSCTEVCIPAAGTGGCGCGCGLGTGGAGALAIGAGGGVVVSGMVAGMVGSGKTGRVGITGGGWKSDTGSAATSLTAASRSVKDSRS